MHYAVRNNNNKKREKNDTSLLAYLKNTQVRALNVLICTLA